MPGMWATTSAAGGGAAGPIEAADTTELTTAAQMSLYINGPQGIYDPASNSTFFAVLREGRDLYVGRHFHLTGETEGPVFAATNPIPTDTDVYAGGRNAANNHGAPTIALDADGYIHVVWGSHDSYHRHVRSDAPRDITAWTTTVMDAKGTYPRLALLSSGDLLLFDRAGPGHGSSFPAHEYFAVRRLPAGSSTWGARSPIIDTTGTPEAASDPYVFDLTVHDDLIHITWTVARGATHDGDGTSERTNVYHAVYDPAAGTIAAIDGTDFGATLDWTDHTAALAYTVDPVSGGRHLVLDDGRVMIATASGASGLDANYAGSFTFRVVTWDGTAWSAVDTQIPQEWWFGGVALYELDDQVLLLTCERIGGTRTDLTAYLTTDGATFTYAGTILDGADGEGIERLGSIAGDGPWLTLAQGMLASWDLSNAAPAEDLLPVYAISRPAALNDHTHTDTGTPTTADEIVFAPAYSVTDGTTLDLAVTFVWGIDGTGEPYYNAAGVGAGDEAVLVLDNATGDFALRPVEV